MNDADRLIETLLQSAAPSPPSRELRERIEAELKPTLPTTWKIGVAAVITALAAAIALMITQLPTAAPDDEGQVAKVDDNQADEKDPAVEANLGPAVRKRIRGPRALGPWIEVTPSGMLDLLASTDVILHGLPERAADGTLRFTVQEVLWGKLQAYEIDAAQDGHRLIGNDAVDMLHWPLGQMCCVYLEYNEERDVYQLIEHGQAIHELPYQGELGVDQIRDIAHIWYTEFKDVEVHNYSKHAKTLGEREELVLDLIFTGPDKEKHQENLRRLKAMKPRVKPKASMPIDIKVTGVQERELKE